MFWSQEAIHNQQNNVGLDSNHDLDPNPDLELDESLNTVLVTFLQDEGQ
jgi:hypothetical protein